MRRIPQSDQAMRRGEWPMVLGYVLKGKTLGILGLGKIGTEVAAIARAFGMNVIAGAPRLRPNARRNPRRLLALDDVMREAIVSIHLALSDQSRIFEQARLRLMKRTAYLVNTARGAIVDENALAQMLKERAIADAALDVFVEEPCRHILTVWKTSCSPHLGWPTDSRLRRLRGKRGEQHSRL
jgi:phosphoglycerate dehydrogenase-like enzyme